MNMKFIFGVVLGLILGAGGWMLFAPKHTSPVAAVESAHETRAAEDYYTCPMHPSVRSDKPGACPVCGMALVKKSAGHPMSGADSIMLNAVRLSPTQRVMANVSTVVAERKTLTREFGAVGVVDFAEPNYKRITMRFPGRLDKLHLTYTGQTVRKGDPVADVYSPDAISAQQEYLIALASPQHQGGEALIQSSEELLHQSKERLLQWGFTEKQVDDLAKTKSVKNSVTIYSPVSGTVMKKNADPQHYANAGEDIYEVADLSLVWVYLDVYEKDIRFIRAGQSVHITTDAYPNERFAGKVTFIDPVVNPENRTIRVRTEFVNSNGRLKPNMYVKGMVSVKPVSGIVVPSSAVLSTGSRNVVWVEVRDNTFEPRDVQLGISDGGYIEIQKGLNVGDRVAETGGYLIDSESSLSHSGSSDISSEHDGMSGEGDASKVKPDMVLPSTSSDEIQDVSILVKGKFSPDVVNVQMGRRVRLHLNRDEDAKCSEEIVFDKLGIRRKLAAFKTTTIEFVPKETGEITFTCGMNMLKGKLVVSEASR